MSMIRLGISFFIGVAAALSSGLVFSQSGQAAASASASSRVLSERQLKSEAIRTRMVRDAAMSAAMRAGLANHSVVINKLLASNARFLDDIWDFSSFMLENNVVPPVIRRAERITEQEGDVLRFSAVRFRIVRQAYFATRAPSWRQYLMIPVWEDLGKTHESLMPQSSEERNAAREGIEIGWAAGEKQANDMFYKGLTKLENDFMGMATYHALLKSNMVTLPKVLRKDIPIVGDGSSMTLDQSTYTIESRPVFNPRMMSWVALIEGNKGSAIFGDSLTPSERDRLNVSAPGIGDLRKMWLE